MNVTLTAAIGTFSSLVLASFAGAATCDSLRSAAIPGVSITTAEVVAPPAAATGRGAPGLVRLVTAVIWVVIPVRIAGCAAADCKAGRQGAGKCETFHQSVLQ